MAQTFLPEGNTSSPADSEQRSLWKLVDLANIAGGGGGGGTTEIATGAADPVGAPAAGIILFARTDIIRLLQWNGAAWVVIISE
jgi:hypothetical protein